MTEQLERIWVHPDLKVEFEHFKNYIEEKTGRPVKGGVPIISKIVAEILKKNRLNDKKSVRIEMQKVKGENKNEVFFVA